MLGQKWSFALHHVPWTFVCYRCGRNLTRCVRFVRCSINIFNSVSLMPIILSFSVRFGTETILKVFARSKNIEIHFLPLSSRLPKMYEIINSICRFVFSESVLSLRKNVFGFKEVDESVIDNILKDCRN